MRLDNIAPLSTPNLALLQWLGVPFETAPPTRFINPRGACVDINAVSTARSHRASLRPEQQP